MEIECGEYVRTRAGHFYKITRIDENGLIYWNKIQCGWSMEQLKGIVVKHSKNIIDLIEVGDYVNGYKVIGVTLDPAPSGKCVDIDCDKPSYESYLFEEQIYSIVTKEQFASMEYKVEEEQKQ